MRNLAEFPITLDEKIEAVEWAVRAWDDANPITEDSPIPGPMIPIALGDLLQHLKYCRIAEGLMSTGD